MSVCAITGAASGIGAAIRLRLEADGARVIHPYVRAPARPQSPARRRSARPSAIAPGPVKTPLLAADSADPVTGPAIAKLEIPLGRLGEPDEIAELAAFLLHPRAGWIHGSIVYIDGGNDAEIRPDRF